MRFALAIFVSLNVGAATPAAAHGQNQVQTLELGDPELTLEARFSSVRGVRELSSGALLVADWIEERVFLVDLQAGSVIDRVSVGEGPHEVRLPAGLVALMGDSTLLRDGGNGRLSVLGPDGRVARSLRSDRPGLLGVRGSSEDGELLFSVPAWAERSPLADDSVRVVAWSPIDGETRARLTIQGTRTRRDRGPSRELRLPVVGFAARDAWTVAPDGSIVVVRGGDYSLEFWAGDGTRARGPSYLEAARPVTAADRRRFVERFMAESALSGRGPDGGLGHSPSLTPTEIDRLVDRTEFAERHPPFAADRVLTTPSGQTWVGLSTQADSAYDVFGRDGVRIGRVRLPGDRVVALVGVRGVYVVRTGDLGLQSIERYPLPMSSGGPAF